MSHVTIVNRSQVVAAATAITAIGLLTVSSPAQAHPMLPLDPPCSQYGFDGVFTLQQSNGAVVRFNSSGPVASGTAVATVGADNLTGPVTGGVQGRNVDFTINWNTTVFERESRGHYTGSVGNDGFAHGNTVDEKGTAAAFWDSTVPLVCDTPASPPPPPAAAPPPPQNPLLLEPATELPNRREVPPFAPNATPTP
jgi:hypothetical protein